MTKSGIVLNCGKKHKEGGRMPVVYELNRNAACFAGIEVHHHHITYGICDFNGKILLQDEIIAITISIPGRVHTANGESFNYFDAAGKPLAEALEESFGIKFYIDNDSRVMCYVKSKTRCGRPVHTDEEVEHGCADYCNR